MVLDDHSWSFMVFTVILYWGHAVLAERQEPNLAGPDWLNSIDFYHRPSDLCGKLFCLFMFFFCFPANVGCTLQLLPVSKSPPKDQCVMDVGRSYLSDRIQENHSHWYKTNQRLRTAFPVSLWKNCYASGWCGMIVDSRWVVHGSWLAHGTWLVHGPWWHLMTIHGHLWFFTVILYWGHAVLEERQEPNLAGPDWLNSIEFYHRPSDLCGKLFCLFMSFFCFPANVGCTLQLLPVSKSPRKTNVLWMSADLTCLTGSKKITATGTRQTKDWGQGSQYLHGKVLC